jgi:methionine-rich copper-binding protein CopC
MGGGILLGLVAPAVAFAHVELLSSSPAPGEVVDAGPVEVVLTFDLPVVGHSSFSVLDANGLSVATGGPDPAEPTVMRASIPKLSAGTYTVKWTSVAEDGYVERGSFTFDVAVPSPPIPTATPGPTVAVTAPTIAPSEAPTASPAASPSPAPSAGDEPGSDATAAYIPIVIAGLLIGGGLAYFLRRRGSV